jgi:hypothetical protein
MTSKIVQAIATIAIDGTVQRDGKVRIAGSVCDNFPTELTVEGQQFDLSEIEDADPATGYTLAYYAKQILANR